MGQFSMTISAVAGPVLGDNQHTNRYSVAHGKYWDWTKFSRTEVRRRDARSAKSPCDSAISHAE